MHPTAQQKARPTLAERQARWICELEYDAIPAEVLDRARLLLMDFLSVARRGATLPQTGPARALFADMGGAKQSSVIGYGLRTSAAYAALANGVAGHAFEYDDAHWNCGHPGVCVIPAVLALAEREGASGRDVLTAIIAGYQAMVYSMGPINRITLDIGWHGTKIGGGFGAAAASAKLLGLSGLETAHALAIVGSEASGTMEYDQSGGEVKRFHAGIPARAGVESAVLARAGLTGPLTIFEGRRGIHRLFSERGEVDAEPFWDGTWHIMNTFVKLYPMVGTTHAALDALHTVLKRHPDRSPADIDSIEVGLVDWALPHGAAIVHPHDMLSAQFSLAFACALRVIRGEVTFTDLSDPAVRADPAINALAEKVSPNAMAVPEGADQLFGHVEVRFADGTTDSATQGAPRGHPANPARNADVQAKSRDLLSGLIEDDEIDALHSAVEGLDADTDIARILALLA